MASERLIDYYGNLKNLINENGISAQYVDILVETAKVAFEEDKDIEFGLEICDFAKKCCEKLVSTKGYTIWDLEKYWFSQGITNELIEKYYSVLKTESYYNFESYMFFMEKKRDPSKRFYLPRMETLHTVVEDLTRLDERKLKFYGLSMASRTGKSTLCIFFLSWVAMKRPNSHSAMGGHSGILAKGFYKELINLMTTEEYTFQELFFYWHPEYANKKFPTHCSAEDFTITLGNPDRFATITCRGIDGTWTGAIDVSWDGYLYVDDLVRDREHSLSPTRMESTFQEYLNKMVDRKSGFDPCDGSFAGARELMVGTLWNVMDPLEKMRNLYEQDKLYEFRRIPALDENEQSNYPYVYSTEYLLDMRERLDDAEWQAKWIQRPYVREGLLYGVDEVNYFNGILPDGDYRIVAACDVALGGGDNLSMPVAAEYSNGDVYVFGWVFNNGPKEVTRPKVAGKIMENEIREIRFEANQGGDLYCDYIDQYLREQGYKCSCTHKRAPNKMDKMSKIIAYSGDIKRKFYFLQSKKPTQEELEIDKQNGIKRYVRDNEYQCAMDELHSIVTIGKNVHEDSVDGLTQLAMFIENNGVAKIEVPINPFRY